MRVCHCSLKGTNCVTCNKSVNRPAVPIVHGQSNNIEPRTFLSSTDVAFNLAISTGREIAYSIYEELAIVRKSLSKEDAKFFYEMLGRFDHYKIKGE